MLDYEIGKVVGTAPLTVSVGSDTAQPTVQLGVWTPVVDAVVLVLVEVSDGRRSRVGAMPRS